MAVRLGMRYAAALSTNDSTVTLARVVIAVAAATPERGPIVGAGLAALLAGAISAARARYATASGQRDAERSRLGDVRRGLREEPEEELSTLARILEGKGLSPATARTVSEELTEHDALRAHLDHKLGLDPDDPPRPWSEALAVASAYALGALLPLLAITLPGPGVRVWVCAGAALVGVVGVVVTSLVASVASGTDVRRPLGRLLAIDAATFAATYGIGFVAGASLG